jgi:hypothetical protein
MRSPKVHRHRLRLRGLLPFEFPHHTDPIITPICGRVRLSEAVFSESLPILSLFFACLYSGANHLLITFVFLCCLALPSLLCERTTYEVRS